MSHDAYFKAFVFASFATISLLLGFVATAVYCGLMCLVYAIDGATKAIVATLKAPAGAEPFTTIARDSEQDPVTKRGDSAGAWGNDRNNPGASR